MRNSIRTKGNKRRVGYLDIETADWTTFVVGGTLLDDALTIVWHDADSYREHVFAQGGIEWRAHNGGRFDFLFLLEFAQRIGAKITATMRGSSIVKARVESDGQVVTLVDTFALAPISLKKYAACAGQTQKGEIDYADIVPGLPKDSPKGRLVEEYLVDDLRALRDADMAWRQTLREVARIDEPSLTLGGTAWKSAAKHLTQIGEDISAPLSEDSYADGRAGYFGGRVEVFQTVAESGFAADRNSSYPAALTRQPVPCGRRVWRGSIEKEGTVWATVKIPEMVAPPLPVRLKNRLAFPVGVVKGVWTALELRNAMALGVKILKVHKSRSANTTTLALGDWCQRIWQARVDRPAYSTLLKLLANSLTGKLAQAPEKRKLLYLPADELPEGSEPISPIGNDGRVWVSLVESSISHCARPEWSAYLTSEARIELLAQIQSAGENAVYSDTDSVFSTAPLTRNLGLGLGQWKSESEWKNFLAVGPKFYKYDTAEKQVTKAKGYSKITRDEFDALLLGGEFTSDRGARSLRQSLNTGLGARFLRQTVTKKLGRKRLAWAGSRLLGPDGRTLAPTLSQLESEFG